MSNIPNNTSPDPNVLHEGEMLCNPTGKCPKDSGLFHYEVKPGDSLYQIAQKFNLPIQQLIQKNPSLSNMLYVGQILCIPEYRSNHMNMTSMMVPSTRVQPGNLQFIGRVESREGANIYRFKHAVIFKSDMDIDIDGDSKAYHPNPRKAKTKMNWHAIAKDKRGQLCPVQGPNDPNPGYYPSGTSLYDLTYWLKNRCDPRGYVNPDLYPYFVLPFPYYKDRKWGPVTIGDLGTVINTKNGKMSHAIFADAYLGNYIGEGSTALAKVLDIDPDPNFGGEESKSIIYIVYPGSGKGQGIIPTVEEIRQKAELLFEKWGGMKQVELIQKQLK